MKVQTGRLANPRKPRKKPARAAAARKPAARKPAVRRRRRNPSTNTQLAPVTAPRRRKSAAGGGNAGSFSLMHRGKVMKRRANPSGSMVIGGVHIGETAMMVLSGGAAAFAGAIVVKYVDEKFAAKKWARVGIKFGAAFTAGIAAMKMAESEAAGGMIVIPIGIGFAAPMIASALADVFGVSTAATTAKANKSADTAAGAAGDAAEEEDDDMDGFDDDENLEAEEEDDDVDADIAALQRDMQGIAPSRAFNQDMSGRISPGPAPVNTPFADNFMQGMAGLAPASSVLLG